MNIQQFNGPDLTAPHSVTNSIIEPLMQGNVVSETTLTTTIHEFLFKIEDDQSVYWIGAAVPFGTIDFTKAQIFFHPTVVQSGQVIAAPEDYPEFKGGWSGTIQRYIAMEGGQLAGARLTALLVPFTTMAALNNPGENMFSIAPIDTLNAIMAAIKETVAPFAPVQSDIASIGVTSFSSGITAMRLFINDLATTGLVQEVTDLDSPYIITEPKSLTGSPGAVSRCYTQFLLPNPPPGWSTLPAASFKNVTSFPGDPGSHAHACIGFMMYYSAALTSIVV